MGNPREPRRGRIVVVGSSNMDLVVRVPRLPAAGETLSGHDFRTLPGGKGANQAVAAARLSGDVAFMSCVGADDFGARLRAGFVADGIDVAHVAELPGHATGIALITVAGDGANSIVLSPGANGALVPAMIDAAEALIATAALLVCQLEIPPASVRHALEVAARHGTPVLLNPAPAVPLDPDLLRHVDILVPNEIEAGALTGIAVAGIDDARRAAEALRAQGPRDVIVTLGAQGLWHAGRDGGIHLPAPPVAAIDSTAAGDTLIGGIAAALAAGADLRAAIAFGMRAAAISVTRVGAQASIPWRRELDAPSPSP